MQAAGLTTYPYHVHVPTFGSWGYIIAAPHSYQLPQQLTVPLKYLDMRTLVQLFVFPKDMQPLKVDKNTLNHQKLVSYYRQDWARVVR